MEQYYKVLLAMNKDNIYSQRQLAEILDISVGKANSLMKIMEQEGFVEKNNVGVRSSYQMTKKGEELLEKEAKKSKDEKLSLKGSENKEVKAAVILGAGENKNFDKPVGLLEIEGQTIIDYIIKTLMNHGVDKIYLVVGYKKEAYEEYFKNRNVTLITNNRYKWTGTMASLSTVADDIKEDFLLIDSNQIFEEEAIHRLLSASEDNCMFLASPSSSGDEAYVELDKQGNIFRIGKDIKQLNRIDGELLGLSRISYALFEKMLEYYEDNENPFLNYEYAIEAIGRIYNILGVMVDDLVWALIETPEHYQLAKDIIFPKMKKRMILKRENNAKSILVKELGIKEEDITLLKIGGGMTNSNFFVVISGTKYMLRLPGACTEEMINRRNEKYNAKIGEELGLNPPIFYFNEDTGVKLVEYIKGAETLNGRTARLEVNMKETASILKRLHESNVELQSEFQVFHEYQKYIQLIEQAGGNYYEGFRETEKAFLRLEKELEKVGVERKPCHNDTVAENFVKDEWGRMYLIDWEYSGENDPMWDVAAHLLECEFKPVEEELFLRYYFEENEITPQNKQKILIYKICQDMLWSAWTIAKEAKGEEFGSYGEDRYKRAKEFIREYEENYGKI